MKTGRVMGIVGTVLALVGCGPVKRPDGGEGLLPVGAKAPDLEAVDQNGTRHRIADEKGHPLVVYFYPKDATPGCTKEACAFRDAWARYEKAGVRVFGVSADNEASHAKFAKDQKLPFPILSDPENRWAKAFGVTVRLGMPMRVSFLIDAQGKVIRVYPDVDPGVFAEQVLADATGNAS